MVTGVFSGKLIKSSSREPVQRGPLPPVRVPDPRDALIKKSVGSFPYEPNGPVQLDPQKIEYLKS